MFNIGDKVAFNDSDAESYVGHIDYVKTSEDGLEYYVWVDIKIIDKAAGELLPGIHAVLTEDMMHLIH